MDKICKKLIFLICIINSYFDIVLVKRVRQKMKMGVICNIYQTYREICISLSNELTNYWNQTTHRSQCKFYKNRESKEVEGKIWRRTKTQVSPITISGQFQNHLCETCSRFEIHLLQPSNNYQRQENYIIQIKNNKRTSKKWKLYYMIQIFHNLIEMSSYDIYMN